MLFVPGHKIDWMRKAPKYGADALILDLEDSVPIDLKEAGRQAVRTVLDEYGDARFGKFVRVNAWQTGHLLADLLAVVSRHVDGILLPKTQGVEDVVGLDLLLGELEMARSLVESRIEIMPLAESARGFYLHYEICLASDRIRRSGGAGGLPPGGDGTRALGLRLTDEEGYESLLSTGRGNLEARAAGITQILGGMTSKLGDLDLVRRLMERSKRLGASGAMAIHPSHIPVINEVFSPSAAEIEEAKEVIRVMAGAVERGDAAVRHGNRMVDYAHARTSVELLEQARDFGIDVGEIPKLPILSF